MKCKGSPLVSVLGLSDGKANQSLNYSPKLESIWVLEPTRGKTWVKWDQVRNFSESDEKGRHYVLDSDSGLIRFGDGIHGRIPQRGAVIKATYRTSCGRRKR